MKRTVSAFSITLLLSLVSIVPLWAQGTAQINGTVRDQSGAVLPGVEITATQTQTGIPRTTTTNETGSYVLPNLLIGTYRIEAALPGFRTFVQTRVELQVNGNPVINPVLVVGQVTEQVEVQANAALVETRNQGVGQVIENSRILELPFNGRSVQDLISLSAATVPVPTGSGTLNSVGLTPVFNNPQQFAVVLRDVRFRYLEGDAESDDVLRRPMGAVLSGRVYGRHNISRRSRQTPARNQDRAIYKCASGCFLYRRRRRRKNFCPEYTMGKPFAPPGSRLGCDRGWTSVRAAYGLFYDFI